MAPKGDPYNTEATLFYTSCYFGQVQPGYNTGSRIYNIMTEFNTSDRTLLTPMNITSQSYDARQYENEKSSQNC